MVWLRGRGSSVGGVRFDGNGKLRERMRARTVVKPRTVSGSDHDVFAGQIL